MIITAQITTTEGTPTNYFVIEDDMVIELLLEVDHDICIYTHKTNKDYKMR